MSRKNRRGKFARKFYRDRFKRIKMTCSAKLKKVEAVRDRSSKQEKRTTPTELLKGGGFGYIIQESMDEDPLWVRDDSGILYFWI